MKEAWARSRESTWVVGRKSGMARCELLSASFGVAFFCVSLFFSLNVILRRAGSRVFYAVFEGKSSLTEAHEEVKRVSQVFFNGMFID